MASTLVHVNRVFVGATASALVGVNWKFVDADGVTCRCWWASIGCLWVMMASTLVGVNWAGADVDGH